MDVWKKTALGALAGIMIATPMVAQKRERLSRECTREIVKLCGTGRLQIRACLQSKFADLCPKCQDQVWNRMQDRLNKNRDRNAKIYDRSAKKSPDQSIAFGEDERQQIDFYAPLSNGANAGKAPLVLFVHGGGWSIGTRKAVDSKPTHFTNNGLAFASTGYRLLPDAPVEEQAKDVGLAIQTLHSQAAELGFDPENIVVMGHSAGAHLAALVSTDPQYAGKAFSAIQGVVLLDGSGYDVEAQLNGDGANTLPGLYKRVFGTNKERQIALSPIRHVGSPDAPAWLVLHVADRPNSSKRSNEFGAALGKAGLLVKLVAISDTDHSRMNRQIGEKKGDPTTTTIDAFLERVFN